MVLLLAGVVTLGATPVAEARVSPRVKAQIVRRVKPLVRDTRTLPRQVSRFSKRRSHRQAGVALRAARRGRWCAVTAALGQIDRVGRAGRHVRRVSGRCAGITSPGVAPRPSTGRSPSPTATRSPSTDRRAARGPPGRERSGRRSAAAADQPAPRAPRRPRTGDARRGRRDRADRAGNLGTQDPSESLAALPVRPHRSRRGLHADRAAGSRRGQRRPLDPSVATAGNVVLVTGNLYFAFSKDAGKTFKYLNPVTDIYKKDNPDGGACCDQVVHYDAATNRFYWLLQYWCTVQTDCKKRPGTNRIRIAEASPERLAKTGGRGWTYYDFLSTDFEPAGDWIDFPDMAVGQSFLYVTINCPSCTTKTTSGAAIWMRLRKDQLAAGGSLDWPYIATDGEYIYKPVQNTRRTGYVVRRSGTASSRSSAGRTPPPTRAATRWRSGRCRPRTAGPRTRRARLPDLPGLCGLLVEHRRRRHGRRREQARQRLDRVDRRGAR